MADAVPTMTVNGSPVDVAPSPTASLLTVLREHGLRGTTAACEEGEGGSCSGLVDGELVCSCLTLAATCAGRAVTTVEGVVAPDLADALVEHGAVQCGFCTPGFVVAAVAALAEGVRLERAEVVEALSGNLCRCTGYQGLIEAVRVTSLGRSRS